MKKSLYPGLIVFMFLLPTHVPAEILSLDRDSCLELALSNNRTLLEKALSLETSRRNERASWNLFLPDVSVSLNLSGGVSPRIDNNTTLSSSINPGVSLSYTFVPGIKETLRQLKLALESSEISYEKARLTLLMNVEIEFYYLLTSRNNLEIQENNIELAKKQHEQTQVKFNNGLVSQLEVLQAEVNAANLVPTYSSLESSYKNRLKEFLVILGIDPLAEVELVGNLEVEDPELDAAALIAQYLDNRADIRAQRNQLEILESGLSQARKSGYFPSISLSASWSEKIEDPFSASTWQDYSTNNAGSLSLGIRLGLDDYIPGSSTNINIKKIEDSIAQGELSLEQLTQEARLEIINLVDSIDTDRKNLELSGLNLELSETSYKMTEESFTRGKSDRISLDKAQQELLTARQNLLESRYQYLKDLITLRGALGLESLDELQ